jgi:chromosome segregation ATPase
VIDTQAAEIKQHEAAWQKLEQANAKLRKAHDEFKTKAQAVGKDHQQLFRANKEHKRTTKALEAEVSKLNAKITSFEMENPKQKESIRTLRRR